MKGLNEKVSNIDKDQGDKFQYIYSKNLKKKEKKKQT
jgi:hypothetical protein